jgi:hypothetical protein
LSEVKRLHRVGATRGKWSTRRRFFLSRTRTYASHTHTSITDTVQNACVRKFEAQEIARTAPCRWKRCFCSPRFAHNRATHAPLGGHPSLHGYGLSGIGIFTSDEWILSTRGKQPHPPSPGTPQHSSDGSLCLWDSATILANSTPVWPCCTHGLLSSRRSEGWAVRGARCSAHCPGECCSRLTQVDQIKSPPLIVWVMRLGVPLAHCQTTECLPTRASVRARACDHCAPCQSGANTTHL